jgi:hypothetical protein
MSLRDPVRRAYSQYQFFKYVKRKEPAPDFSTAIDGMYYEDYVHKSQYARQIERLYETFGEEKVKIVIFEKMSADPTSTFQDIFSFLGAPAFQPDFEISRQNFSSSSRLLGLINRLEKRHPFLRKFVRKPKKDSLPSDEEMSFIYDCYFREDVKALSALGVDTSLWAYGETAPQISVKKSA